MKGKKIFSLKAENKKWSSHKKNRKKKKRVSLFCFSFRCFQTLFSYSLKSSIKIKIRKYHDISLNKFFIFCLNDVSHFIWVQMFILSNLFSCANEWLFFNCYLGMLLHSMKVEAHHRLDAKFDQIFSANFKVNKNLKNFKLKATNRIKIKTPFVLIKWISLFKYEDLIK